MIKVLLVDDHGLIRKAIRMILAKCKHIELVGEASDGDEAFDLIGEVIPDVIVTDVFMPKMTGLLLCKKALVKYPEVNIIVLSAFYDESHILDSFEAGALCFLPKSASGEEIIQAIDSAANGDIYYPQSVVQILGSAIIRKEPMQSLRSMLTTREKEILKQIVNGFTNKEIAQECFISVRTVDAHRRNIMKKLNVTNSAQMVKLSLENNIV